MIDVPYLTNRQFQAVIASIKIGGKFFCLHDYTSLIGPKHDGYYQICCVECGKMKKVKLGPFDYPFFH